MILKLKFKDYYSRDGRDKTIYIPNLLPFDDEDLWKIFDPFRALIDSYMPVESIPHNAKTCTFERFVGECGFLYYHLPYVPTWISEHIINNFLRDKRGE